LGCISRLAPCPLTRPSVRTTVLYGAKECHAPQHSRGQKPSPRSSRNRGKSDISAVEKGCAQRTKRASIEPVPNLEVCRFDVGISFHTGLPRGGQKSGVVREGLKTNDGAELRGEEHGWVGRVTRRTIAGIVSVVLVVTQRHPLHHYPPPPPIPSQHSPALRHQPSINHRQSAILQYRSHSTVEQATRGTGLNLRPGPEAQHSPTARLNRYTQQTTRRGGLP
jgi:hypothetical protein